ncbi:MAG: type II toxin-antitoxin system VapC family toxin [Propionibacteriaceae bacterium]|nr:type II toxin-antitoxin system VapC family toxin [Propionibacteriaceae bacterium]
MKILLDTHTVLWAATNSKRLSRTAMGLIEDESNELLVSAVCPWEMGIKLRLGKLHEAESLLLDWERVMSDLDAVALPVTHQHAISASKLVWDHRDPFDRLLGAQSVIEDAMILSADYAFDAIRSVVTRLW